MELFGTKENTLIGFNKTYDWRDDDAKNGIINGRVCETGYAGYTNNVNEGECTLVTSIRNGTVAPETTVPSPYICDATHPEAKCYYYKPNGVFNYDWTWC